MLGEKLNIACFMDEVCQSTKSYWVYCDDIFVQTFISPNYPDNYSFNPSNSLVYNQIPENKGLLH